MANTADFEAGVNGNTITTGAGEGSLTPWDTVTGTPTYDNTQVAHGTLAGKCAAAGDTLFWNNTAEDHYGRIYLRLPSSPSVDTLIVSGFADGVAAALIYVRTAGDSTVLRITDFGAGGAVNGSVSVATGQWIRVEYHIIHSGTVGFIQAKLFNSADSSVPSDTLTGPATWNTGGVAESVRYGFTAGGGWASAIWLDDIVAVATSYPGSAVVESPLPILIPSPVRW